MPKLPYFPLNPWELLLDEKIQTLELEEVGATFLIWCWQWINPHKRGHLLYDKKTPISDEQIAKNIRLDAEKFKKMKEKFLEKGLHKIGKYGEMYSERLSKYKTPYELYEKDKKPKPKHSGNVQGTFRDGSGDTTPNHTSPDLTTPHHTLPNIHTIVELFNSVCVFFPKVKFVSDKRKKKLICRLREHPDTEWWQKVFEKIQSTKFLRGENKSGWKCSFDWLIENDTNAIKVFEGNYEKEEYAGIKQWGLEQEKIDGQD